MCLTTQHPFLRGSSLQLRPVSCRRGLGMVTVLLTERSPPKRPYGTAVVFDTSCWRRDPDPNNFSTSRPIKPFGSINHSKVPLEGNPLNSSCLQESGGFLGRDNGQRFCSSLFDETPRLRGLNPSVATCGVAISRHSTPLPSLRQIPLRS